MNRFSASALTLAASISMLVGIPARADDLVAHAGLARYALAADEGAFLDWLDPQSRAVFTAALGGDHGALGDLWSQLMAGAIQMRREDAYLAETLWFNPLFDAGLAARWERRGDQWIAVAAIPITGEMLRGEPLTQEPVRFAGSIRDSAQTLAVRSWAAAADTDWLALPATNSGTAVLARMGAALTDLDLLRASPGYEDAGITARTALATGDDSALPPPIRASLQRMGDTARLSLRPVAGYRRVDGWTMALQSPDAPMLAWLVHFADPAEADAPASVLGYQLLNLGDAR